jgi:tetratricopeptide (TPR) repeat protein
MYRLAGCMSRLLEILGRGAEVDVSELIWNWLKKAPIKSNLNGPEQVDQLNKALRLMGENKYESATGQLRLYLFENPSCIYGRLAAASICVHNNQLFEAIKELNSVYLRRPNNTIALYALGHCYERLGKEADAVEFYQDCLKFKRYFQLPAQRLAAIYFKNRQIESAIQQYELLSNEYPEDISTLIALGYLYLYAKKYIQAGEVFNNAILIHPDNFISDYYVDQLIEDGQIQEALDYTEDSLQKYPDRADLMMKYAEILCLSGDDEQAAEQYERAIFFCPDFLEARIKLGMHYLKNNQELLAAEQFNIAIDINDNIVDAYIGLSISQYFVNDFAKAADTLSLACAIQPNSSILFTETASLNLKLGLELSDSYNSDSSQNDFANAIIEAHRQQILISDNNPDLYYRFGILMMNFDRFSDAIASFENALNINQNFWNSLNKLAVCLVQTGRFDEAAKLLADSISINNDTIDLHYKTVILSCDKLKFASSIINLENNYQKNLSTLNSAQNISIILQNLGLLDRTEVMWDNLLETTNRAIDSQDSID